MHLGRTTLSAEMDVVEVKGCIKCESGYWENDIHDNHYSSRLPLSAMRGVPLFYARSLFHSNSRATFFGEKT